ncbi:MAG: pilus assembly protein PilM [bacterium]|nr:pilus assembly protein PilM [bacterium]
MARSCGIRVGPRLFELVVLDGSAKKHKIAAYKAGEFDASDDDSFAQGIAALKEAIKSLGVPRENVGLVVDSRHAAFRRLTLPFSDRSKIEQVIKYEVEGDLPQWNIDDVIVDFHVVAENDSSSEVLTSAIPKEHLADSLEMCERAGIEPLEAELETSAIVNAALAADICHADDAQLLVHVGEYSTSVVVMDAGEVREMRVIHIGALTHDVARSKSSDVEGEEEAEDGAAVAVDPIELNRRIDQAVKRIRRELGRTISGARTVNPIDAVYVCGIELPGLIGDSVLDVPVYLLDCFEEDSGQPAEGYGVLVAAYGAAVRQLGGGKLRPSLRREELRYSGTWERLEFPMAVACLFLCTFALVVNLLQYRERNLLESNGVLYWLRSSNNYMIGDLAKGLRGNLSPVPDSIKGLAKKFRDKVDVDVEEHPPLTGLRDLKSTLESEFLALQKELGQESDVQQPQSALAGMNLVLGVLKTNEKEWRPSLRKVVAVYQPGKGGRDDTVKVTVDVTFFADEGAVRATRDYNDFRNVIKEQYWVVDIDQKSSEELEDGKGIFIQGLPITVDVAKYYEKRRQSIMEGV